jgi:hypothetical protein
MPLCKPPRRLLAVPALLAQLLASSWIHAQTLQLTLASEPPAPGRHSTLDIGVSTLAVASGQRVALSQSRGREFRANGSVGLFWTQVQELPRDQDAVALTPVLKEDGSVTVQVEVYRKRSDREDSFSTSVTALPGEWTQLYGPALLNSRATRVYGTQPAEASSLYLYLQPDS